jgi:hypothetical protein
MIEKLKGAVRSRLMQLGTILIALGGWEGVAVLLKSNLSILQPLFVRWPWLQTWTPLALGCLIWYLRWTTTQSLLDKARNA